MLIFRKGRRQQSATDRITQQKIHYTTQINSQENFIMYMQSITLHKLIPQKILSACSDFGGNSSLPRKTTLCSSEPRERWKWQRWRVSLGQRHGLPVCVAANTDWGLWSSPMAVCLSPKKWWSTSILMNRWSVGGDNSFDASGLCVLLARFRSTCSDWQLAGVGCKSARPSRGVKSTRTGSKRFQECPFPSPWKKEFWVKIP